MIVTLCGSVRFEAEFINAQRELGRRGVACFSLAVLPAHRETDEGWKDGEWDKTVADLVYYNKILHSDAIVVLGDGYIGQSTSKEIIWAWINGKGIIQHLPYYVWEVTVAGLRSGRQDIYLIDLAKKVIGGQDG